MKQNGFTLVELLAIIVLLSLIFTLTFPSLLNMNKRQSNKEYESMVDTLCMAGEAYIYANIDNYKINIENNSTITLAINDLVKYGNVESGMINPKTNKYVSFDGLKFTVNNDKTLTCEYQQYSS